MRLSVSEFPVRRLLAPAAALVLCAGCGISDEEPRPGVAAEVDGEVLSLHDLDALVDGVCASVAADETAVATTRTVAETDLLQSWIATTVILTLGEQADVSAEGPGTDPSTVPGWDEMDERERAAIERYLDEQNTARATLEAMGSDGSVEDLDVVVNPRYDLEVATDGTLETLLDAGFVAVDETLSVSASDEAAAADALLAGEQQVSVEQIATLPDAQICGERPDPSDAAPEVPLG